MGCCPAARIVLCYQPSTNGAMDRWLRSVGLAADRSSLLSQAKSPSLVSPSGMVETPRLHCAKKERKFHAVREMRVGPSKLLCREELQTAASCCGPMAMVVNVVVKRRG